MIIKLIYCITWLSWLDFGNIIQFEPKLKATIKIKMTVKVKSMKKLKYGKKVNDLNHNSKTWPFHLVRKRSIPKIVVKVIWKGDDTLILVTLKNNIILLKYNILLYKSEVK